MPSLKSLASVPLPDTTSPHPPLPSTLLVTVSPPAILALFLLLNHQDMFLPQGFGNGCSLECSSLRYHHCSFPDLTTSPFSKLIFTIRSIMTILFNLYTTLPALLSSNSWMPVSCSILFFSFLFSRPYFLLTHYVICLIIDLWCLLRHESIEWDFETQVYFLFVL